MSRMQRRSFEDIARAFHEVAQHLGVPVEEVSRRQWKRAVKAGARFSVGANAAQRLASSIGGWAELRSRVVEAGDQFDAVRVAPLSPLPEGQGIRGVSTLTDGRGNVKLQWIKTRAEDARAAAMASIMERLPEIFGSAAAKPTPPPDINADDVAAVYGVGDLHVGMRAWCHREGVTWDLDIAESIALGAFEAVAQRGAPASTGILINVGDWHHHDGKGVTPKSGHLLDNAGSWAEIVDASFRIQPGMIDILLRHHERVIVFNAIGNHDLFSTDMFRAGIAAWYRNEPRVTVDRTPGKVSYHQHGKCMLATTHGDLIKMDDIGSVMACDQPRMWGETVHRYAYTGHVHHKQVKEYRGVVVESLRTLAAKDSYASDHGYRAGRDLSRISLHREWGEVARNTITAQALQAQMAA